MEHLYRSGKERKPGGICGDLSEHIDVDPTIITWIVIPESPEKSMENTLPSI